MEWFPKVPNSYWTSKQNVKRFIDNISLKLNIRSPKEWGQVSNRLFKEVGGASLLTYYKNSLFFCLQAVYEGLNLQLLRKIDIEWKREWFANLPKYERSFWNSEENCKHFLNKIATEVNIQTTNDWRKISISLLKNNGGNVSNTKCIYKIRGYLKNTEILCKGFFRDCILL